MNDYKELGFISTPTGRVSIAHSQIDYKPWRCTYGGGGHYFDCPKTLSGYVAGRGWCSAFKADELGDKLTELAAVDADSDKEIVF